MLSFLSGSFTYKMCCLRLDENHGLLLHFPYLKYISFKLLLKECIFSFKLGQFFMLP